MTQEFTIYGHKRIVNDIPVFTKDRMPLEKAVRVVTYCYINRDCFKKLETINGYDVLKPNREAFAKCLRKLLGVYTLYPELKSGFGYIPEFEKVIYEMYDSEVKMAPELSTIKYAFE